MSSKNPFFVFFIKEQTQQICIVVTEKGLVTYKPVNSASYYKSTDQGIDQEFPFLVLSELKNWDN